MTDNYKYQIFDELFNYYCDTNKVDYLLKMLECYPNRYHVIMDGELILNAEIIKNGDLSHKINPNAFSDRFKLFLVHEKMKGKCLNCLNYVSLIRLNCNPKHYLCLDCLKNNVTFTGLCIYCNEEISLMDCSMYINH